ncbi:chromosomal replication initiator protein DnaA, partial [Klebsiella oxytoca]
SFKRDLIAARYVPRIQNALRELFSSDFEVEVVTQEELGDRKQPEKGDFLPGTEDYTFDRFVVGSSNKFAHAAA